MFNFRPLGIFPKFTQWNLRLASQRAFSLKRRGGLGRLSKPKRVVSMSAPAGGRGMDRKREILDYVPPTLNSRELTGPSQYDPPSHDDQEDPYNQFDAYNDEVHYHIQDEQQGPPPPASFPYANAKLSDDERVFVSDHFRVEPSEMESYLSRKGLEFRSSTDGMYTIKECPFCHPIKGKLDNMWKLVIFSTGGYFCHRCNAKGSWFDFKKLLQSGDLEITGLGMPNFARARPLANANENKSQYGQQSGSPSARTQTRRGSGQHQTRQKLPNQSIVCTYPANLDKYPSVLEMLTGSGEGQRGLLREVLDKYMVGVTKHSFPSANGRGWEDLLCVTFPWARKATPTERKQNNEQNVLTPLLTTERVKLRALKNKGLQRLEPKGGPWGFFGWHLFEDTTEELVITEGEYDAMAVHQATGLPAVSLPSGARNLPPELIVALEKVKRIYLWMDDDVPGQEGAEIFSKKLGLNRVLLVKGNPSQGKPPKDANEALKRGLDLNSLIRSAAPFQHDSITTFSELRDIVYQELSSPSQYTGVQCQSLPGLNRLLKGHRRGELTVFTGPTGSGKTTVLSQLSVDLCANGAVNTLWGSFEIKIERLAKTQLCQFAGVNFREDMSSFSRFADDFEQLPMYFLRHFGSTDLDQVLDAMDYAVYVHDVRHIILDNLQFMLSGQHRRHSGPRKFFDNKFDMMDDAISRLREFATTKNCHVTLVIHPRKETDGSRLGISSVFGSAKATQEADNVIILNTPDSEFRNLEVKKNRFDGELGKIEYVFDKNTLRILETGEEGSPSQVLESATTPPSDPSSLLTPVRPLPRMGTGQTVSYQAGIVSGAADDYIEDIIPDEHAIDDDDDYDELPTSASTEGAAHIIQLK